ncbi:hypothetical protein MBLNU13_g11696t1 [Cladosporium sp. NU13]
MTAIRLMDTSSVQNAWLLSKTPYQVPKTAKMIKFTWKTGTSLSTPDARARLMSNVEEGRGSADNSDFRIDSESEDDTQLSSGSSSGTVPVGNRHPNNADVARRDLAPGAARPL